MNEITTARDPANGAKPSSPTSSTLPLRLRAAAGEDWAEPFITPDLPRSSFVPALLIKPEPITYEAAIAECDRLQAKINQIKAAAFLSTSSKSASGLERAAGVEGAEPNYGG